MSGAQNPQATFCLLLAAHLGGKKLATRSPKALVETFEMSSLYTTEARISAVYQSMEIRQDNIGTSGHTARGSGGMYRGANACSATTAGSAPHSAHARDHSVLMHAQLHRRSRRPMEGK